MATETLPTEARAALAELLRADSPVQRLAHEFAEASRQLYLVGGALRDALLQRETTRLELDFATDAPPEETGELLAPLAKALWLQGARYGTVGAEVDGLRLEITTFRTEKYQPSSRHPEVAFAADIKTDLSRRDFTINSIALRLPDMEMVDLFDGRSDLDRRIIRTPLDPLDSFSDDPLRMLRAFRFASELDFRISEDVLTAVTELKGELQTVSAERIRDEFSRLITGRSPGHALRLAEGTGLTELFLPELSSLKLEQDPVHRHKDVFAHTLAVIERTDPILELRLAALLHDVGKPKTRRIDAEGVSFHHHEVLGAEMAVARLRALRFSNETVDTVRDLIRLHHRFHTYRLGWTDAAVRRYVRDAGPLLGLLNDLVRADCTTRNPQRAKELGDRMDELERRIAELAEREEIARIRPELDGFQVMAYLGVPGGPLVGEAMEFLLEIRLEEGLVGSEEAYARLDAWARARGIEPPGEKTPPKKKKKA